MMGGISCFVDWIPLPEDHRVKYADSCCSIIPNGVSLGSYFRSISDNDPADTQWWSMAEIYQFSAGLNSSSLSSGDL